MNEQFLREALIIGEDGISKLKNANVAVFGVGGVGSYCVEALVRAGIGKITIFDGDTFSLSNLNRQLFATYDTIGKSKVEVAKQRIQSINSDAEVTAYPIFYMPENADKYPLSGYSYIVDAIDNVTAKIHLAVTAEKCAIPIISSMGTGNKLNPLDFKVDDIYNTSVCPLARIMRKELKSRGVQSLKVVYSTELPHKPLSDIEVNGKIVPGSISFVPPVAGMILASEVIKDILGIPLR